MIETIFLLITLNGGPIVVKPQYESMFAVKQIPGTVVQECAEWSGVDPYSTKDMSNVYNELYLMECFFYDIGAHEHNILQEHL